MQPYPASTSLAVNALARGTDKVQFHSHNLLTRCQGRKLLRRYRPEGFRFECSFRIISRPGARACYSCDCACTESQRGAWLLQPNMSWTEFWDTSDKHAQAVDTSAAPAEAHVRLNFGTLPISTHRQWTHRRLQQSQRHMFLPPPIIAMFEGL